MGRVTCTNGLEKIHPGLVPETVSAIESCPGHGQVLLCDGTELPAARRREDWMVCLSQGAIPAMERLGANLTRITYDIADATGARAALLAAATRPGQPICADSGSVALLTLAERVAASTIPVLVEGPTGTGKEVLARFIHNASPRSNGPFVAVNCAAMPEAMLEALLFGHRKGAFTGASEAGEGFFRAADGGTLLLDEIGEMPLGLQAKLLRALQEGEVVPLGATQPIPVDVRIIACTNRDLPQEIAEGHFREDLYYRLNVFPLRLEALRQRRDDIAPLAFAMLLRHTPDGKRAPWIAEDALAKLAVHPWPGNIRELENVMRRALLLAGDVAIISGENIVFDTPARAVPNPDDQVCAQQASTDRAAKLSAIVRQSEAQAILDTLDECSGNRLATARQLGISERTLRYRLASMREAGLMTAGAAR